MIGGKQKNIPKFGSCERGQASVDNHFGGTNCFARCVSVDGLRSGKNSMARAVVLFWTCVAGGRAVVHFSGDFETQKSFVVRASFSVAVSASSSRIV